MVWAGARIGGIILGRVHFANQLKSRVDKWRITGYSFGMTGIEQSILAALMDLDESVRAMKTALPKPNLVPLFARIDELTRQLPPEADPNLLHYLHKKSYAKARLFLEGREVENQRGNCRHVN